MFSTCLRQYTVLYSASRILTLTVLVTFTLSETKKTPKKSSKAPKRTAKSKKVAEDDISDNSSEEEDEEEPTAKKAKKMPTDEELKKTVLGLLENVDLEKVTMKNVLQQVSFQPYRITHLVHSLFTFSICNL